MIRLHHAGHTKLTQDQLDRIHASEAACTQKQLDILAAFLQVYFERTRNGPLAKMLEGEIRREKDRHNAVIAKMTGISLKDLPDYHPDQNVRMNVIGNPEIIPTTEETPNND